MILNTVVIRFEGFTSFDPRPRLVQFVQRMCPGSQRKEFGSKVRRGAGPGERRPVPQVFNELFPLNRTLVSVSKSELVSTNKLPYDPFFVESSSLSSVYLPSIQSEVYQS